jgi:hypothetical protein
MVVVMVVVVVMMMVMMVTNLSTTYCYFLWLYISCRYNRIILILSSQSRWINSRNTYETNMSSAKLLLLCLCCYLHISQKQTNHSSIVLTISLNKLAKHTRIWHKYVVCKILVIVPFNIHSAVIYISRRNRRIIHILISKPFVSL